MPGAGGIACAVLNFRRLGFSSCAQDTVYVVHSFKVRVRGGADLRAAESGDNGVGI